MPRINDDMPAAWQPLAEWTVTAPAAVDILWRPAKRVNLRPFLGRESSLAQAAAELGVKKTAMSYWIDRLLEAGLIRTTRIERIGRNRVPFYRCLADRLRVALEHAPLESYESICADFSSRWRRVTEESLAQAVARQGPSLELVLSQGAAAGVRTDLMPREGADVKDDFVFYWARLWLGQDDRDALQRELDALWERYAARSDRHQHPSAVLLHLLQVPEAT